MPYTDVPVDINETFSVSQPKIKENFLAINTVVSVDHVTFDAANQGKHNQVTMPVQAAHPTTTATEVKLYSYNNGAGNPALWFQPSSVLAAADGVDFTTCLQASPGWTRLPSGILLKWGYEAATAGSGTYAFPVGAQIPVFSHIYDVQICPYGDGGSGLYDYMPYLTSFTATGISIYGSARTTNAARTNCHYRYLVIGD